MNQISKVSRGQIWYAEFDFSSQVGRNPNLSKCRPYLIISSNEGNFSSDDIVALPISSNSAKSRVLSVNVQIILNDKVSYILCSKPTNLTKESLQSYVATVSDPFMEEVERSLLIALGMSSRYVLRDKQVMELRDLVSEYRKIQNFINAMKCNCIDSISDITTEFINNNDNQIIHKMSSEVSDLNKSNDVESGTLRERKPKTRSNRRWTYESAKEFIDDYENNSVESMMEYYMMTSVKSVQNTYYSLRKRLDTLPKSSDDTE